MLRFLITCGLFCSDCYHAIVRTYCEATDYSVCISGVPLLIVGGTVIYDMQYYSAADSDYCLVSSSKPVLYYVTYLGPSCLILVVNLIVFLLVSKVLFQRRHSHAIGKVAISTDSPTITVAQVRQKASLAF
jgi:hypothetical protein